MERRVQHIHTHTHTSSGVSCTDSLLCRQTLALHRPCSCTMHSPERRSLMESNSRWKDASQPEQRLQASHHTASARRSSISSCCGARCLMGLRMVRESVSWQEPRTQRVCSKHIHTQCIPNAAAEAPVRGSLCFAVLLCVQAVRQFQVPKLQVGIQRTEQRAHGRWSAQFKVFLTERSNFLLAVLTHTNLSFDYFSLFSPNCISNNFKQFSKY